MSLISWISNSSTYVQFALGVLGAIVLFVLLRRERSLKLNEPPLVPYKYPIIGHTIDYYNKNEVFIKECQESYGEIFSLYVYGRIITIVGKELSSEVFKNHQHFDFGEAQGETFPLEQFMDRPHKFFDGFGKVIRDNFSGRLMHYIERVHRQLIKSVDIMIGDSKVLEPAYNHFRFIIARPIAASVVGEEFSDDKELVNLLAHTAGDLSPYLTMPPFFGLIHPSLHTLLLILGFRYLHNPFRVHRELIKQKIAPVIEKRLSEMKKLGNSYIPPIDLLQQFIEIFSKDFVADIDSITAYIMLTAFAAVHTTSLTLTFCIHEFLNNPQCHKELLEEQEQLHKSCGDSYYSIEQIAKLEKLDSFIRETLRFHLSSSAVLQHKTLVPYHTFSNGYQVPKGRFVYIRGKEIHFDEGLQGQNPNEFNAFRHLKGSNASRIERNFVVFGLGKHACPGRFFAINEVKIALHHILLNYNIRKVNDNGKIKPMVAGPFKHPSNEALIFEKKQ